MKSSQECMITSLRVSSTVTGQVLIVKEFISNKCLVPEKRTHPPQLGAPQLHTCLTFNSDFCPTWE